jgi:hypothetical protein
VAKWRFGRKRDDSTCRPGRLTRLRRPPAGAGRAGFVARRRRWRSRRRGDALGDIALFVPGIAASPPPGEQETADTEVGSRFRVFDAISQLLAGVTAEQPIVIIIENLHLADAPSLSLLEFIVPALRSMPLLIVGTYRDVELSRGHPMSGALGRLDGQPDFHRIHLQGLEV